MHVPSTMNTSLIRALSRAILVVPVAASLACGDSSDSTTTESHASSIAGPLVCSRSVDAENASITGFLISARADGRADVKYVGKADWVETREPMTSLEPVDLFGDAIRIDIDRTAGSSVYVDLKKLQESSYSGQIFIEDYFIPLSCVRSAG